MQQHHKKSAGKTKRDRNDRYETPEWATEMLVRALLGYGGLTGPVLEPACGSGRMVREVRRLTGLRVVGRDIEDTGHDFLAAKRTWPGSMVTNPPYHKDMPLRFAQKAHEVVDGRFAMLLQGGFLWTDKRSDLLREGPLKPELVLIVPYRIYFYRRNGKPIEGQAYSHCWVAWPERERRLERSEHSTQFLIGDRRWK